MAKVLTFHSVNEVHKPPEHRVHHNNDRCGPGKEIPLRDRRGGPGGYRLCDDCKKLA